MEIIQEAIQQYCDMHTSPEGEVLKKLNRDTYANVMQPRMLSGHFQGRLLSMLSHMIKPKNILEIGTYTGYSAICLAEGLQEGGRLITIDVNAEQEDRVRKYVREAGMENKIQLIIGDALNVIKALDMTFDIVFIDADKPNYPAYYDLVMDKVVPGGYIIADNVLWSGKVIDEKEKMKDKDTQILDAFNKKIQNDPFVENILLPVRDGLMILRKI
jgi:caffeoyl-CoA O-methyltransferase